MSFHVGQIVVCIDDHEPPGSTIPVCGLRRGVVYTVRKAVNFNGWWDGVFLEEIIRPIINELGEYPFYESRFRPVDETRLEIFRKIAASPRQEVDA